MELIYAYAEKYRIFEHQEFSFSDRFRVHFDEENRKLTIQKNENDFDLYPRNILGISAVVGKTSLLSMLGDSMESGRISQCSPPSMNSTRRSIRAAAAIPSSLMRLSAVCIRRCTGA